MSLVEIRRMVPDTPLRRGDRGVLLKTMKNTGIETTLFRVQVAGTEYTLLQEDFSYAEGEVSVGSGTKHD